MSVLKSLASFVGIKARSLETQETVAPVHVPVDVLLCESSAPIGEPLAPRFVVQATLQRQNSTVYLLDAERNRAQNELEGDDSAKLYDLYMATRLSVDDCQVEGEIDTSDFHSALAINVRGFRYQSSLFIGMLSSGFTGRDAQALRKFGRALLTAVDPQCHSFTLGR